MEVTVVTIYFHSLFLKTGKMDYSFSWILMKSLFLKYFSWYTSYERSHFYSIHLCFLLCVWFCLDEQTAALEDFA